MEGASSGHAVCESPSITSIEIDPEIAAVFEALPNRVLARNIKEFTAEQDAILLKYWPIKNHEAVAHSLGVCKNTALKRFRELNEKVLDKKIDIGYTT